MGRLLTKARAALKEWLPFFIVLASTAILLSDPATRTLLTKTFTLGACCR